MPGGKREVRRNGTVRRLTGVEYLTFRKRKFLGAGVFNFYPKLHKMIISSTKTGEGDPVKIDSLVGGSGLVLWHRLDLVRLFGI